MRFFYLVEYASNVNDLSDYLIAFISNGIEEIPTTIFINKFKRDKHIDVTYEQLMDLLDGNPLVKDINKDIITLNVSNASQDDGAGGVESSEDSDFEVKSDLSDPIGDMARRSATRSMMRK